MYIITSLKILGVSKAMSKILFLFFALTNFYSVSQISNSTKYQELNAQNLYGNFEVIGKSFDLNAKNSSCGQFKKKQIDSSFLILNEESKRIDRIALAPNQELSFILKTDRLERTILNAWNFIEIYAEDFETNRLLSTEMIKSYMPNPISFN